MLAFVTPVGWGLAALFPLCLARCCVAGVFFGVDFFFWHTCTQAGAREKEHSFYRPSPAHGDCVCFVVLRGRMTD